jgi:hypothetical protein
MLVGCRARLSGGREVDEAVLEVDRSPREDAGAFGLAPEIVRTNFIDQGHDGFAIRGAQP